MDALSRHDFRTRSICVWMPIVTAVAPVSDLERKGGQLQTSGDEAIQRASGDKGKISTPHKPITWLFSKVVGAGAAETVISKRQHGPAARDGGFATRAYPRRYPNPSLASEWGGGSRTIAATLFHDDEPRCTLISTTGCASRRHHLGGSTLDHPCHWSGRAILGEHGVNIPPGAMAVQHTAGHLFISTIRGTDSVIQALVDLGRCMGLKRCICEPRLV